MSCRAVAGCYCQFAQTIIGDTEIHKEETVHTATTLGRPYRNIIALHANSRISAVHHINLAVVALAGEGSAGFFCPDMLVAKVVALEGVPG